MTETTTYICVYCGHRIELSAPTRAQWDHFIPYCPKCRGLYFDIIYPDGTIISAF